MVSSPRSALLYGVTGRYLQITGSTRLKSQDNTFVVSWCPLFTPTNDTVMRCEFDFVLDGASGANYDWFLGFSDQRDNGARTSAQVFWFWLKYGLKPRWFAVASDYASQPFTGPTSKDTGVDLVTGIACLTLEWHGKNTPIGAAAGAPVMLYYIDGNLVATNNDATKHPAFPLYFTMSVTNQGVTIFAPHKAAISPLHITYTRYLSAPNV
jgi:hypothetical protein